MNETGERIKELRTEKKLTQSQLATHINFGHAIVGFWESGKRKPAADAIIALCKFFNVSADYLLGLSDNP